MPLVVTLGVVVASKRVLPGSVLLYPGSVQRLLRGLMPPTVPPKSVRPLALTMRLKGVSAESESTVEENVTGPAVAASPELIVTSTPSCTGPRYTCPAAPVVVTLPPRLVGPLAIARLPRGVVPPTGAANVVPFSDDTVGLPCVVALRSTLTELEL